MIECSYTVRVRKITPKGDKLLWRINVESGDINPSWPTAFLALAYHEDCGANSRWCETESHAIHVAIDTLLSISGAT